jgi:hypothetical protein
VQVLPLDLVAMRSDEQDRRSGGRGERRRCLIRPRRSSKKICPDRVASKERDLIDHHRHSSSPFERVACPRERASRVAEQNPVRCACLLPEAIEKPHLQVLRDHHQLAFMGHGTCGQIPIARMRRRDHETSTQALRTRNLTTGSLGDNNAPDEGVGVWRRKSDELERRNPE